MINVKELRIGNFVTTNDPADLYITKKPPLDDPLEFGDIYDIDIVNEISMDGVVLFNHGNYGSASNLIKKHSEEVNPIPLTIEWLEAFGAKEHESSKGVYCLPYNSAFESAITELNTIVEGDHWKKTHASLLVHDTETNEVGVIYPKYDIRFVHQFQNMYFALTGEELSIKELV